MNLLFVSSEYPPDTGFGGIGTYTRIMARALTDRGHQVEVIARAGGSGICVQSDGPVKVHRIGPGNFPLPEGRLFYQYRRLNRWLFPHTLERLAFANEAANKFKELSLLKRFDVVECAECGAEGTALSLHPETKLVVRLHTPFSYIARLDHLGLGFWDSRRLERLERSLTVRADGVTSPTQAMKKLLAPRWQLKQTEVFFNPLDVSDYSPRQGRGDYIIYTGRVEYRKGVHVLLKAYAQLLREGTAPDLVLAGAPYGLIRQFLPYERLIEDLIRSLNLTDRVRWIKSVNREALKDLLAKARVAVYPSLWENLPYACLEAMVSGIPVIASRCGGLEEIIIHGENGLLFQPLSSSGLCAKLKELLSDEVLSADLAGQGRARVLAVCAPDVLAARAETFYQGLLNG